MLVLLTYLWVYRHECTANNCITTWFAWEIINDVNKDWTHKDQDKDKDQSHKDKDKDKDKD